jgi:hypothetical protein
MPLLFLALLAGAGFTSLAVLALTVHFSLVVYFSLVAITPGGVATSLFLPKWSELGHPIPVLLCNVVIYSSVAYPILKYGLRLAESKVKKVIRILLLPVVALFGLACVPPLSPIWPHGMQRLKSEEQALRADLTVGMGLTPARAVLKRAGLSGSEQEMHKGGLVFSSGKAEMTAQPGETAVWARSETIAEQFPCSYVIHVVMIFGTDGMLRDKYVGSEGICP